MMDNIFQQLKDIPFPEVFQAFNNGEIRKNKAHCPFHQDKTPSFHIYQDGYKCFSCGVAGDNVSFVSALYDLQPLEAAKVIAYQFGIEVNDKPLSKKEKVRLAKKKAERERKKSVETTFYEWAEQAQEKVRALSEAIRLQLDEKGVGIDDGLLPLVHELPRLEWWADILESGTDEEKLQLYRDPEVRRWLCEHI